MQAWGRGRGTGKEIRGARREQAGERSFEAGPGEFFFWTHFRLSLWREVLLRMRSVNCHGNVQMN